MTRFKFYDYVILGLVMVCFDLAFFAGTDAELRAKTHGAFGVLFGVYLANKADSLAK
jgi:hypothetical protein